MSMPEVSEKVVRTPGDHALSDQIETAHRRVLAYLKALHIPVQKRYELAALALADAEKTLAQGGDCIAAAMDSIEALLRDSAPDICLAELSDLQVMPPVNRGSMIPVDLDRSGPVSFFLLFFIHTACRLLRPPVRLYVLLLLLAAAAGLYCWYYTGR